MLNDIKSMRIIHLCYEGCYGGIGVKIQRSCRANHPKVRKVSRAKRTPNNRGPTACVTEIYSLNFKRQRFICHIVS